MVNFYTFGQISLMYTAKIWINNTAIWSHCSSPSTKVLHAFGDILLAGRITNHFRAKIYNLKNSFDAP